MMLRALSFVLFAGLVAGGRLPAGDWITAPSYFTHGATGERVQQFAPIGPFYVYQSQDYVRSGYRHTRNSLQFGGSVDHYHVVEQWGPPVRPYDEWRYPYRPYSVPYPAWGPPYAGLGLPFGYGRVPFFGGSPANHPPVPPGGGPPNQGMWGPIVPYQGYQPWFDDRYPAFDDRAPFRSEPFPVLPP